MAAAGGARGLRTGGGQVRVISFFPFKKWKQSIESPFSPVPVQRRHGPGGHWGHANSAAGGGGDAGGGGGAANDPRGRRQLRHPGQLRQRPLRLLSGIAEERRHRRQVAAAAAAGLRQCQRRRERRRRRRRGSLGEPLRQQPVVHLVLLPDHDQHHEGRDGREER